MFDWFGGGEALCYWEILLAYWKAAVEADYSGWDSQIVPFRASYFIRKEPWVKFHVSTHHQQPNHLQLN